MLNKIMIKKLTKAYLWISAYMRELNNVQTYRAGCKCGNK